VAGVGGVQDTVVGDLVPGGVLRAAGAGISQVISGFVAGHPGVRMIGEPFMQIRQALGTSRTRDPGTVRFLTAFIEELKASGFIRDALRRSGQDSALAAPPQPPA